MEIKLSKITEQTVLGLKQAYPEYERAVELFGAIHNLQVQAMEGVAVNAPDFSRQSMETKLEIGEPLFVKKEIQVDLRSAEKLFEEICNVCIPANPLLSAEVPKILRYFRKGMITLEKEVALIGSTSASPTFDFEINNEILDFLVHQSILPSLEHFTSGFCEKIPEAKWSKGICPICGSNPLIGELRAEEAKKYLFCSFCHYLWRADRIACFNCGNLDSKSRGYFYSEDEKDFRVDFCDMCWHYIKIINNRQQNLSIPPVIAWVVSQHLDVIAADKGYNFKSQAPGMGKV